jgi:hypothetical protein
LLTIGGKDLLTHYGEISMADVLADKAIRDQIVPTTHADARPKRSTL